MIECDQHAEPAVCVPPELAREQRQARAYYQAQSSPDAETSQAVSDAYAASYSRGKKSRKPWHGGAWVVLNEDNFNGWRQR